MEFLSLKGGYSGLSESKLVKMPHCWKSHVAAHISLITQSLEEIHSGRETGLVDTGPLPCLTSVLPDTTDSRNSSYNK